MADTIIPHSRNPRNDLTVEFVRAILDYDPEIGIFRRRRRADRATRWNTRWAGTIAGAFNNLGYRVIGIDGRTYLAHRLAWLIVTGKWPGAQIDHANLDPSDNRFSNLREATVSQNQYNQRMRADNTSGVKGASWRKSSGKLRGRIGLNGKQLHLGYFDTIEEAEAAIALKRAELHGQFGRAS